MLAILFFVISLTFGWMAVRLLPLKVTKLEQAALGSVLGILASSWLLFLGSWLVNTIFALSLVSLLGLAAIILSYKFIPARLTLVEPTQASPRWQLALQIFAYALVAFFLYLCYTHSLQIEADGWYNSGYTWSDAPLHMSLISGFAYRPKFEFVLPVYYLSKLSYPFLIDVYSGALLKLGGIWQLAIFLPTAALLLSLMQLFLAVTQRLLGSVRAAWLHLLLFLFSGSAWGAVLYIQDALATGLTAYKYKDYANLEDDQHLYFANIVTSHLFPQRGFLFGFAIALGVLFLIYHLYHQKQGNKLALAVTLGVIVGLLPFAHVHTFFILAGLMLVLTIHFFWKEPSWKNPWLWSLLILLALALPQLWWQFGAAYNASFGMWFIGWARSAQESALLFWLRNWGLIFIFVIGNFWILHRYLPKNQLVWYLYMVTVLIFLAINVRIFQPNVFDNMKFLIYGYWGVTLVMSYALARWSRRWWGAIIVTVIFLSATFTGALVLARETTASWQEFSNDEIAFAKDFRAVVPAEAKVLTTERHNHPVAALTGRKILLGYPGWLWSYGIDTTQTGFNVELIFNGEPEATPLLHQYGVQYVAFSSLEVIQRQINLTYFLHNHSLVYEQNGWYIFRVL